jgi:hypothetical protein
MQASRPHGPYDEPHAGDQPHRNEDKDREQEDSPPHQRRGLRYRVLLILASRDEEAARFSSITEGAARLISDEGHSPDASGGIAHRAPELVPGIFHTASKSCQIGNSVKRRAREKPGNHNRGDCKEVGQDLPGALERGARVDLHRPNFTAEKQNPAARTQRGFAQ